MLPRLAILKCVELIERQADEKLFCAYVFQVKRGLPEETNCT